MKRRTKIASAVVLSLATAAPGCAGKSPWSGLSAKPDLPAPASVGAQSNEGALAKLAHFGDSRSPGFAEPSVQPPQPVGAAENQTFTGSIGGAVTSAFQKTKEALTIEPTVVRAPDPLSLSTPAKEVGPEIHFASARMHENQGNFAKADELYQKALHEAPSDLNVLMHYARMHDRGGNLPRAAEIYRQAIQMHPQDAVAHNDLGLCLARQRNLPDSYAALRRAAELQPQNALYRNNLATVLVEMGRYQEALESLTPVHGPAAANYNVSCLLYKRGKFDLAATYAQHALSVDPQMAPAAELLKLTSGRRHPTVAQSSEAAHDSAASQLHRMPPVRAEAGAPAEVQISLNNQGAAPGQDWGDAPTPAQVLSTNNHTGNVLMPPSRAPLTSGHGADSSDAMPHLLPPTG